MKFARFLALLFSLALLCAGALRAQQEPTVDQIYQAATSGDLPRAQRMIDQVLVQHPNSAKAHYVKAELSARALDAPKAREELATAERLAPGLPFAKPEAVQALRTQIDRLARAPAPSPAARQAGGAGSPAAPAPAAPQAGAGLPWGTLLVVGAIAIAGVLLMRRRRSAMGSGPAAPYGAGPASYGAGPMGPYGGPGVPPGAGYPGQPYGQPQPGMGSTLGRGVATGLAIGAGAVAAQELGRRMFEHDNASGQRLGPDAGYPPADITQLDGMANADMGGQDFGLRDAGSWDDAGGGDFSDDGGGGWDN